MMTRFSFADGDWDILLVPAANINGPRARARPAGDGSRPLGPAGPRRSVAALAHARGRLLRPANAGGRPTTYISSGPSMEETLHDTLA